ncbi:hypothetical protein MTBBW1_2720003 [Desulfamplus magnetovallimortis]|uniref:Phage replication protein n=1 Tax=Desulfamplus magnetovallimortis TaxID=1246637 RepID=A0A1W1HFB9_9BACT|nr:hypothetical protein [Desulfamplus magnetovallimortis]SLM31126.1 hypothetical protein MTBBW1_2720003 [Desulfamplus magnetovallimortis]
MIIRSEIKSNYTCIQNSLLNDSSLSCKAKCLLIQLLSKPDNWNLNINYLASQNKEGKYSVRTGIDELMEAGYIHKIVTRDKGKFVATEYLIYDAPVSHDQAMQDGKIEISKHPYPKNQTLINTDILTSTEGNNCCTDEPELEQEVITPPKQQQFAPAISEKQYLLDLLPERFRTPIVESYISRAISNHDLDTVKDAVKYSVANVKGGHLQFKSFLDKCLRGKWSEGYSASLNFSNVNVSWDTGKFPNGSFTGSRQMDSNVFAAAQFMASMEEVRS